MERCTHKLDTAGARKEIVKLKKQLELDKRDYNKKEYTDLNREISTEIAEKGNILKKIEIALWRLEGNNSDAMWYNPELPLRIDAHVPLSENSLTNNHDVAIKEVYLQIANLKRVLTTEFENKNKELERLLIVEMVKKTIVLQNLGQVLLSIAGPSGWCHFDR